MSKMTDEQIKKGLECCVTDDYDESCTKCPMLKHKPCDHTLHKNALDLINRQQRQLDNYSHNVRNMAKDFIEQQKIIRQQQAEIEKLNVELVGMRGACESYKMHYDNAKAEIERLQVRLKKERHQYEDVAKMYSEIRAEAFKEVLDRFDIEYCKVFSTPEISFMKEFKRVFLKEMVGDDK